MITLSNRLDSITFAIRHWAEDYILTVESQGASTILQTRGYVLLADRNIEESHRIHSPADKLQLSGAGC